ncbi:MAG: helix-turn-helix transcriptional regulator [Bacteroidota bacterium]
MPASALIPIHDFAKDTRDSVPFRFIPLGALTHYDFSLPHRHNYYEIFFFTKGGGSHFIDFVEYPIHDNTIHFVSPGQVHTLRRADNSYGSIILFSRDFFHAAADGPHTLFSFPFLNNSRNPLLLTTKEEFEGFAPILHQVQNESDRNSEVYAEIIRSYIKVVLLKCLQLFETKYPDHKLKQGTVFNSLREMIEKEYRTQRQPAYYADKLHITEKKLNAICKDNSGESVGDYIRSRITLEAKRLLINTDHNIKEIAGFLGFDDPSYFNRFFRTNAGLTAGDFRKSGK